MPKGPQGQKRPADSISLAVMVARIATGEISDEIPIGHGRAAGGIKRAKVLSEAERKEIARRAAKARWSKQGMECDMKHTALKESSATVGREAVRMYPNNSLREPVRAFENTVFDLVKKTFTK
jgi:hypothetical protein